MSNLEQTLSIVKPDAVERNLQDEIKKNSNRKVWSREILQSAWN